MIPNYYAILGVAPDAENAEIKQAYRRLALQHHPDVNAKKTQPEDTQIKRVNEAYTILSDPRKRAAYDILLQQEKRDVQKGNQSEEQKITWSEGLAGFVREFKKEQASPSEPQMTWTQGMFGFVREFKKGMRDD
jgi:DnaJ-class molecular chaperone